MIEFTRCPKCKTLYELEGIDYSESSGWVQCGECGRKFKALRHAVEPDELSFTVSDYALDESMKMEGAVEEELAEFSMLMVDEKGASKRIIEQKKNVNFFEENESILIAPEDATATSHSLEHQQLSRQTQESDSEFMEKNIILSDEENFEKILKNYGDEIFNPELIDEDSQGIKKKRVKNAYTELHSEFSEEEIIIKPEFSKKSLLEEEIETNSIINTISQEELQTFTVKPAKRFFTLIALIVCLVITISLIALFALQIHSRGTYPWISQKNYEELLSRAPFLANLEKTQTDLSAIHLASTRMEVNSDNPSTRIITLQLVNRSFTNQAYPDFQLEFTNAKGDVIARKVVLPSLYLEKDHLGVLESRQAKIVLLNLESLPTGAVGYQIKVVQQSS